MTENFDSEVEEVEIIDADLPEANDCDVDDSQTSSDEETV